VHGSAWQASMAAAAPAAAAAAPAAFVTVAAAAAAAAVAGQRQSQQHMPAVPCLQAAGTPAMPAHGCREAPRHAHARPAPSTAAGTKGRVLAGNALPLSALHSLGRVGCSLIVCLAVLHCPPRSIARQGC
jgi:hypothetical protein